MAVLGYTAEREQWDELTLQIEFEEWVERTLGNWRFNHLLNKRSTLSEGIGKMQRAMMKAEGGQNEDDALADTYRGRGKSTLGPRTIRLRSDSAPSKPMVG